MEHKKPNKLKQGDTVAIVSQSWGGPSIFPHVYENGLKILEKWGLKIKEMPSARKDADYLCAHPEFRANDINEAFVDKEVKAIFSSIGGDDSVRILPFLDKEIIRNNPKIFMGYSDASTLHTFLSINGVVSFYGPAIMAGFSQMENLPASFEDHVHTMLFDGSDKYKYQAYDKYCEGYLDWSKVENVGKTNKLKKTSAWNFIQGRGVVEGELFGGCIEVLEFLKGTKFWPKNDFWDDKILFLETSECKPMASQLKYFLRNYGSQGIFEKLSGILFGRARDFSDEEKQELDKTIISVVKDEFGQADIPIVTNIDFGHTDPQIVLPFGVRASIDCDAKAFSLSENWLK